jgi:hypothetical protein
MSRFFYERKLVRLSYSGEPRQYLR